MRHETRMPFQPRLNPGMLVRAVVVHHQMEFDLAWKLSIQPFEKLEKFLMPMSGIALADHLARSYFQGRKERGRSVTLVIVRQGSTATLFDWQSRLCPVQGLNLALLIHAQHQGFLRRIEIETHHVGQLLQKLRISGKFEILGSVWLKMMTLPDAIDGGFADLLHFGHGSATPMRCPRRLALKRGVHDSRDVPWR